MFQGKRYQKRSVEAEIPIWLQLTIWGMIDDWILEGKKVDYLQIFELSAVDENGKSVQHIVHKQEEPKYEQNHTIFAAEPVSGKVWVMDNGEYSTMMLPDDY